VLVLLQCTHVSMRTSRVQCACNLTPRVHDPFVVSTQVVMDGTLVANKLPTAMQRENDLIKTIKLLTTSEKYLGKKALPLMARHVFVEVLQTLGV
jgi:hypothetical protein